MSVPPGTRAPQLTAQSRMVCTEIWLPVTAPRAMMAEHTPQPELLMVAFSYPLAG